MSAPADVLWRVNNEYRKRLAQVRTYLELLEQMMYTSADRQSEEYERTLAALRYALEQIDQMIEEHRVWRYSYYYETPESKRMIQSTGAINRALARFTRLRTQHERRLQSIHSLINHLQRPDPLLTRVPNGDLWLMTQFAIDDLNQFDEFVSSLA